MATPADTDKNFDKQIDDALLEDIDNLLPTDDPSAITDHNAPDSITTFDIIQELKNIKKPRSAPGSDGITYLHLKKAPIHVLMELTTLYNLVMRYGHMPSAWKVANVKMLPKSNKDRTQSENYRPITLTSNFLELFEKPINKRLLKHLNDHNTIPIQQAAYRRKCSTTHQLHRLLTYVHAAKANEEQTIAVLLDIKGAFDSVWHKGLIHKAINAKLPPYLVRLIHSYLSHRTIRIQVGKCVSTPVELTNGIPQGGVLSTTLYVLYTADLPSIIDNDVKIALYADDVCIYTRNSNTADAIHSIQINLNRYHLYCIKWHTIINAKKTQAIIIAKRKEKRTNNTRLNLQNQTIQWSNDVKYLGVTLTNGLSLQKHFNIQIKKANDRIRLLRIIFSKVSLTKRSRTILDSTHVRPVITYALPALINFMSNYQLELLREVQSTDDRAILHLPKGVAIRHLNRLATTKPLATIIQEQIDKYNRSVDHAFMAS